MPTTAEAPTPELYVYRLRDEYRPAPDSDGVETNVDAFHGGSIDMPPNGRQLAVGPLITEENDYTVVTGDPFVVAALDGFSPFERAYEATEGDDDYDDLLERAVGAGPPRLKSTIAELRQMRVKQLVYLARESGVTDDLKGMKKPDLVDLVARHTGADRLNEPSVPGELLPEGITVPDEGDQAGSAGDNQQGDDAGHPGSAVDPDQGD